MSVFHGSGRNREKKWSSFRLFMFGLWAAFLWNFPTEWGPWSFGALAVIALALPVADLFAAAPVIEGLTALASIFGAQIAKRTSKSTLTSETTVEVPAERGEGDM